jgi:hypothetical protein
MVQPVPKELITADGYLVLQLFCRLAAKGLIFITIVSLPIADKFSNATVNLALEAEQLHG